MRLPLFILLLSAAAARSADPPPVTITEVKPGDPPAWREIKGVVGKPVRMKAAAGAKWTLALENDDAVVIPDATGTEASLVAAKPGRYLVLAHTGTGEPGRAAVQIGDQIKPPAPTPADPLRNKLNDIYQTDTGKDKAETRKDLAELYRQAVKLCDNKMYATAPQLLAKVREAGDKVTEERLTADKLTLLRKAVAEELTRVLPTDPDALLTDANRKAAANLFERLAAILDSLKD